MEQQPGVQPEIPFCWACEKDRAGIKPAYCITCSHTRCNSSTNPECIRNIYSAANDWTCDKWWRWYLFWHFSFAWNALSLLHPSATSSVFNGLDITHSQGHDGNSHKVWIEEKLDGWSLCTKSICLGWIELQLFFIWSFDIDQLLDLLQALVIQWVEWPNRCLL